MPAPEIGPSTYALRQLLALRIAEATLAAHEAEADIAHWVNGQCQLIAADSRRADDGHYA